MVRRPFYPATGRPGQGQKFGVLVLASTDWTCYLIFRLQHVYERRRFTSSTSSLHHQPDYRARASNANCRQDTLSKRALLSAGTMRAIIQFLQLHWPEVQVQLWHKTCQKFHQGCGTVTAYLAEQALQLELPNGWLSVAPKPTTPSPTVPILNGILYPCGFIKTSTVR